MSGSDSPGGFSCPGATARELARPIVALPADTPVQTALAALADSPSHAILAEHEGRIVGILTERSALALGAQPVGDQRLGDICQHTVLHAEADENYIDAYERMLNGGMRHAVVSDAQGRTLGLLSESAILGRLGIEHFAHLDALEQIMTPRPVTVAPDTPVSECAARMRRQHIGCVVVASDDGTPAGILTTRDVTRQMARRSTLQTLPVAAVMSRPVIHLDANRPVFEAARHMAARNIRHIVVTRGGRLCGIVSEHDIVRCLEHRYVDVLRRVIARQADELDSHRQAVSQANVIDQFLSRSQALGLCMVGPDGQLAFINAAARTLLGIATDASARHLSDMLEALPPDSRLQLNALTRLAAPDGPVAIGVGERRVLVRAQRLTTDASRGTQSVLLILIDDSIASEAGELIGFSRHAFGTMALPMVWAEETGRVSLSNAAFDQLVARTDRDTALDLNNLFDPADGLLTPPPDATDALRVRHLLHRLDGQDIPVELFFSRMAFLGKRYVGGFIFDLSSQQAIEQALQDSEQRLAALLQTSPDFIAVKDPEGRWQLANPAGLRMFGLAQSDWRGKTNRQLAGRAGDTLRDCLERCSNTDQLAWSRREPVRYIEEIPHTEAPGTRSLDMIKTPILDRSGQPKALMVIGRDITERVDAERARREADARLHAALAGMDDLMLIADCAGIIQDHFPKPTPPRFQLPDTALGGLAVAALLPPEAVADFQRAHERLRNGLGVQSFDYAISRESQPHWFNVRLSRHRPTEPQGGGMTVMVRDITASRTTAERLERLEASVDDRVDARTGELQSALEELEAFSYSLSHDLRAPLRAIDGFGRLLAQNLDTQLGATDREYLRRIQASVQRMNGLIDDMLDLARLSRKPVERQTVDISQMAQRVLTDLAEREPDRTLTWEVAHGLRVEADPILMQSVLDNLLGNAWKFTRKTDAAHIRVYADQHHGHHWIVIHDNGAGFDMSYADKLFKPFQRLHSPRDFDGTGIGLATVQRIVSRHGGQIEAEAAEGQGATFRFWLGQ